MAGNRRDRRRRDATGGSGTDTHRPATQRSDSGYRFEGGRVVDQQGQQVQMVRTGTQIDLGDLAPDGDVEEVTATFRLRGDEFQVHPDLSELVIADLLDRGQQIDDRDPRAMTFVKDYAFAHVHPDDQERFWETVIKLRWGSTQIMVLCWQILDGLTENPTGERSDSSNGPLETNQPLPPAASRQDVGPGFPDRPGDRELIREGMARTGVDADPLKAAFLKHIDRIQARTDGETGQVLPINAAVAAQLVIAAKARGIDIEPQSAAATG